MYMGVAYHVYLSRLAQSGGALGKNQKIFNEGAFRAGDPTKHHDANQSLLQPSLLLQCFIVLKSVDTSYFQYSPSKSSVKSTTRSLWMHSKRPSQIPHIENFCVLTEALARAEEGKPAPIY